MGEIVQVEWIDSSLQNGQVDKHDFPRPERIMSIGTVVDRTADYITVARDDMNGGDYRGLCCIPTECIKSIVTLSITEQASGEHTTKGVTTCQTSSAT